MFPTFQDYKKGGPKDQKKSGVEKVVGGVFIICFPLFTPTYFIPRHHHRHRPIRHPSDNNRQTPTTDPNGVGYEPTKTKNPPLGRVGLGRLSFCSWGN
jgi:hypothetical protein